MGRKPVTVPEGVTVDEQGARLTVKGPQGEQSVSLPEGFKCEISSGEARVVPPDNSKDNRRLLGLTRSLLCNAMEGVTKGFRKELVLEGVGFRADVQGQKLTLSAGFSTPVEYAIPENVKVEVANGTEISISGADKQKVGDVAAAIRGFCPAEPYKGKGLRYKDENIRRKVGKTVA
jgi:large subunit ribosomal protein L6